MSEDQPLDYAALRRRFPWAGRVQLREHDLSSRYRAIMAESHRDHEIVEAIDAVRRGA